MTAHMILTDLPPELIDLIIKQTTIFVDNNIPYKFPFTKYFETNLMKITNKLFYQKYKLDFPTRGHYIDILKNSKCQCNVI